MDSDSGQITLLAKQPIGDTYPLLINNGKFFGALKYSEDLFLFTLDAQNQVANTTTWTIPSVDAVVLLPDDNLVYFQSESSNIGMTRYDGNQWVDSNFSIETYLYNSGNSINMWADNNTLIFRNASAIVSIYTRANDGTWDFLENFEANLTEPANMVYNGVDTIFFVNTFGRYGSATTNGYIEIYTRQSNGQWTEQIIFGGDITDGFLTSGIGYYALSMIDKDTLAIGAPLEGLSGGGSKRGEPPVTIIDIPAGSMRILRRQANNQWSLAAQAKLNRPGIFGAAALRTSTHLVTTYGDGLLVNATGTPMMFYSYPLCVFQPVQVTCNNIDADTCQFNFTSTDGYTVTSGEECGAYSVTMASVANMTSEYVVSYSFYKEFAGSSTCNATFTCPLPVAPVDPPASSSNPTAATPGQKVNAAAGVTLFGASLLLVLFALF